MLLNPFGPIAFLKITSLKATTFLLLGLLIKSNLLRLKGGFIGLILNELMNPAPLADGTLQGNMDTVSKFTNLESNKIETNNMVLEKSRTLNNSSKENIFSKMEQSTVNLEPIVLNNQEEVNDDMGSESINHISNVGDPGLDDFYPRPY